MTVDGARGWVLAAVRSLPIAILPADETAVLAAAHIKASFRISYADAFAAEAAQLRRGTLLSGDPDFDPLANMIAGEWLPRE